MGYGAARYLTPPGIAAVDKTGNMATPLLARFLGAEFRSLILQAFICAVAFANTGLVLAASAAISHDVYTNIVKGGKAQPAQQIGAARITSAVMGAAGVAIAFAAEKQNVAH